MLALRGFLALNKGLLFELDALQGLEDISIVPLVSPMIAGPATIAACISFPATYGVLVTGISILCATGVTLVIMLLSKYITAALDKFNFMGALIRITGLIVATIGIQMILNGVGDYLQTFLK